MWPLETRILSQLQAAAGGKERKLRLTGSRPKLVTGHQVGLLQEPGTKILKNTIRSCGKLLTPDKCKTNTDSEKYLPDQVQPGVHGF